ncbi:MAG: DNA repair protein RecO [Verrucomicrobiales bacterium]|nr:DNA repair protein RecO [Verrucomicrobiales bacterium]|tara:strand:- start:928 stop:1575 length:648 start_codon:yes stop_codon:yes gene_type:complete
MDERATGIILRVRPLTESSLIVHWLTEDLGRINTVGKGARKPKSVLHGKLDLYFRGEFSFVRSRRSELHNLRELKLLETHAELRRDLQKIRLLAYITNLIEQTTELDTPIAETCERFNSLLEHLLQHEAQPRIVFAFELKHLSDLGLQPNLDESSKDADVRSLISQLADCTWSEIAKLKATRAQVKSIQQFLHGFLIYHIDRLPKGRAAALKMLE